MSKKIRAGWIVPILIMTALALTSCVRPYPGSEAAAAMPTMNPMVTPIVVTPPVAVATPAAEPTSAEPQEVIEPTPISVQPTAEPVGETTYIVVAGDTLFKIALDNNVTVDEIAAANGIIDVDTLEVGQELIIPAPGSTITDTTVESGQELIDETGTVEGNESASESSASTETDTASESQPVEPAVAPGGIVVIQPGDNLFRIGLKYGCTVEQIARHNGITTPNRVAVGLEIEIPDCN